MFQSTTGDFMDRAIEKSETFGVAHPDGLTEATIKDGRFTEEFIQTKKGAMEGITIEFELHSGLTLSKNFVLDTEGFTPFVALLKATFKEVPDPIILGELIGKRCMLEIKNVPGKDGYGLYSNIKKILPLE